MMMLLLPPPPPPLLLEMAAYSNAKGKTYIGSAVFAVSIVNAGVHVGCGTSAACLKPLYRHQFTDCFLSHEQCCNK